MRSLDPEEAELWARVTATIRPLSRKPLPPRSSAVEPPSESTRPRPLVQRKPAPAASVVRRQPHETATLDGTWDKRLRSGTLTPDRIVDLHGLDLDRAWQAIDIAIERAVDSGERVLLLITGHHRAGEPPVERGRIRAAVHDWLAASRHAGRIAAVRGAHRRHGGGGSLYIVLRRR